MGGRKVTRAEKLVGLVAILSAVLGWWAIRELLR